MNTDKKGIAELADSALDSVAGGYLQVSKWRTYATNNILPVLLQAKYSADASDQIILDNVYNTIQGTLIPGADVCAPVYNLRNEYFNSIRNGVHSASVRSTLDSALNSACGYLDANA